MGFMEALQKQKRELYLLQRKCWRKKGWWTTMKEARHAARRIYRETGIQLYPYRCSHCWRTHLTKYKSAKGRTL